MEKTENQQVPLPGTQAPPYPGPPLGRIQPQPVNETVQLPAYMYSTQRQVVQPVNQVMVVQYKPTDAPSQTVCPYCQTTVITKTVYKNGTLTWLICGLIALFLLWPFCWIPFCVSDFKDVEHFCPKCNRILCIYKRL